MHRRHILLVLLGLSLAGCGALSAPSCAAQSDTFLKDARSVAQEWDDAVRLTSQTPRAALPAQIQNLQSIRRKAQALHAPDCAQAVQTRLAAAMDASIDAYLAFLSQQPDVAVRVAFQQADAKMVAFRDSVAELTGSPTSATTQKVFEQIHSGLTK